MTLIAFLIGLPMLKSEVAFNAVASISVIGLYVSLPCLSCHSSPSPCAAQPDLRPVSRSPMAWWWVSVIFACLLPGALIDTA